MSRASATVTFEDGLVLHALYNGTVDQMIPNLFATYEEMSDFWNQYRRGDQGDYEPCGCAGEPCTAEHTYGGSRKWAAKACRMHLRFIGPFDPDGDEWER